MKRHNFTQCDTCGNHTVMGRAGVCMSCGYFAEHVPRRGTFERVILATGFFLSVAFVAILLSGHL